MPSRRQAIYDRDGGVCVRCGQPVDRADFQVDHYPIPRALGGPSTPDNLRVAHRLCNLTAGREVARERRRRGLPPDNRGQHRVRLSDEDLAEIVPALRDLAGSDPRRERVLRLAGRLSDVAPGNPEWRLGGEAEASA